MLSFALSSRADMQHHTHFRALYQPPPSEQHTHNMGEAIVLYCMTVCFIQWLLMHFLLCHAKAVMACDDAEDELLHGSQLSFVTLVV